MRWRRLLAMTLMVGLVGAPALPVQAATVHQATGALTTGKTRVLNDDLVHFKAVPRSYAPSPNLHGSETIASNQGAAVTFTTKYLLPLPGYHGESWGNPQSMVTVGRYVYIVYCPTTWENRGRIVRFDQTKLAQLRVTPRQLQQVFAAKMAGNPRETAIAGAIKIGPAFTTGHGQSLAYNWRDHQFYMWQDRESAPRVPITQEGVLQRISPQTLRPVRQLRFRLRDGHFAVPGGHVLTFDKQGRAYFWTRPSASKIYLYQGTIGATRVHFRLTSQVLDHGPGTRVQSMAYNPQNDRLYLVSDDSIASLPVSGLGGSGHLTASDVRWTGFAGTREFEALNFTAAGRATLLTNHDPEILQSTTTSW
ncbi:hypothetical protein [Levilactobacillus spicheri]|uniref:Extracellular protein n=2 Tax=Levilactobacillus spicheri TaxID=216463 RepID=A0ABQ0WS04_9LACO|nr:hypothetical protein [Levilactobacillus spicheri]GEO67490.1 hypothetical protein LSP04_19090 [Levilactobacillus spicheri]